ncbi:hypothetical protein ACSTS3_17355 [Aquimarina muelleri]|uniref:hypothetical protein n=1 Tax=Aquimarina muelleri TaxID=279356 RepID=UPI003F686E21
MIILNRVYKILSLLFVLITCTQCASQQIDKKNPVEIKEAYFQRWISGVEGGGSGLMVYIEINENTDVQLEYAYFKGKKIKLGHKTNERVYVGRYSVVSKRPELIMSDNPKEEFKNKLPDVEEKIPFTLKENECMISYIKNGKKGFFKLDNIVEKEMEAYPMQRRQ